MECAHRSMSPDEEGQGIKCQNLIKVLTDLLTRELSISHELEISNKKLTERLNQAQYELELFKLDRKNSNPKQPPARMPRIECDAVDN